MYVLYLYLKVCMYVCNKYYWLAGGGESDGVDRTDIILSKEEKSNKWVSFLIAMKSSKWWDYDKFSYLLLWRDNLCKDDKNWKSKIGFFSQQNNLTRKYNEQK